MESSGEHGQVDEATAERILADLLVSLPDPLDMSGEELDDLFSQVDDLVGVNVLLRQVISRSFDDHPGASPTATTGGERASLHPLCDASPRDAHGVAWERFPVFASADSVSVAGVSTPAAL
eukprot:9438897-Alexandrium_andersonii.AAC.1